MCGGAPGSVFYTGDGVVEPGSSRDGTGVYNSNRFLLSELLDQLGAIVTDLGILPDDPDKLSSRLADAAAGHDFIVTSGGVSTGEADYVRHAVERIGSLVFWRVAIKPGRPVALGVIRRHPGTARHSSGCRAIQLRSSSRSSVS